MLINELPPSSELMIYYHVLCIVACWGHHTVALSYCRTIDILYVHNINIYIYYGVVVRQYDSTMDCWGHRTVALSFCRTVVLLIYYFHTTLIYILWCNCMTVREYDGPIKPP